jgi:hypothetical protein
MGKVRRARRASVAAEEEGEEEGVAFVVVVVVEAFVARNAAANRGLALPPSTISRSIFSCSRAAGVRCASSGCACAIDAHWDGGENEKRGGNRREAIASENFSEK